METCEFGLPDSGHQSRDEKSPSPTLAIEQTKISKTIDIKQQKEEEKTRRNCPGCVPLNTHYHKYRL